MPSFSPSLVSWVKLFSLAMVRRGEGREAKRKKGQNGPKRKALEDVTEGKTSGPRAVRVCSFPGPFFRILRSTLERSIPRATTATFGFREPHSASGPYTNAVECERARHKRRAGGKGRTDGGLKIR